MDIKPTTLSPSRQHYASLPDTIWQQISAHVLSAGQGRYGVGNLQSAMAALPGLAKVVEQDPVLGRLFLLQKKITDALYNDHDHLIELGVPSLRKIREALSENSPFSTSSLLRCASLDKLSSSEQTFIVNAIRYNPDTERRLQDLSMLCEVLPQLTPDLRHEVANTVLHRERQDIIHLEVAHRLSNSKLSNAGLAKEQLKRRTTSFNMREEGYKRALRSLIPHFRHLTSFDQGKLLEQAFEKISPDYYAHHLACAADLLTRAQQDKLFKNCKEFPAGLAAGAVHFSGSQVRELYQAILTRHSREPAGGHHIAEMVVRMGNGISRIGPDFVEQLQRLLPEMDPQYRAVLLCALAPWADKMPREQRQALVTTAHQIAHPHYRGLALTELCHNITALSDRQQDELIDILISDACTDPSIGPALGALGEQYVKLSDRHQQRLLTVANKSTLDDDNLVELVDGLGRGFGVLPAATGVALPWDTLLSAIEALPFSSRQDQVLYTVSNSLNMLLNQHLRELGVYTR